MNKYACIALAGLTLGLSSCLKEDLGIEGGDGPTSTATQYIDLDSARRAGPDPMLGNTIKVKLAADSDLDELRAMGIQMVPRTGKDYKNEPYVNEVKPHIIFKDNEDGSRATVDVFLTLIKVKNGVPDPNSVFSQNVVFQLQDYNQHGAEQRYLMDYSGEIALPPGYDAFGEQSDGQWYIMGMMGGGSNIRVGRDRASYGFSAYDYSGSNTFDTDEDIIDFSQLKNYPFASNWVPLTITKQTDGRYFGTNDASVGKRLHFKPLGVYLQIESGTNVRAYEHRYAYSVVSNVLDFHGDYDFSPDAVVAAFNAKGADGIGLPQFTENRKVKTRYFDSSVFDDITLYDEQSADYPLSSAERAFPWDMPAVHQPSLLATKSSTYTGFTEMEQGKFANASWLLNVYSPERSLPEWSRNTHNTWIGIASGMGVQTRTIQFIWARPKDVLPNNPYTYVFTHLRSRDKDAPFVEPDNFNPKDRVYDIQTKLVRWIDQLTFAQRNVDLYSLKKAELEAAGDKTSATYQYVNSRLTAYQNTFNQVKAEYDALRTPAFIADSTKFYDDYLKRYLNHTHFADSESVPLYQTTQTFRDANGKPMSGKVVHIHSLTTSDLMISEVHYHKENGVNYSAVELTNRSYTRLDLSNYALVRMKPNATDDGFAFRKEDGTLTDKVTEAQIFPLRAIHSQANDPMGQFSAFKVANPRSFAHSNMQQVFVDNRVASYNAEGLGEYAGIRGNLWTIEDSFMPGRPLTLLQGRAFVFGASGYKTSPVDNLDWWTADYKPELTRFHSTVFSLHAFVAYDDAPQGGQATLDMDAGDAFALIKKTDDKGGWQIIDATGPIGSKGYAFSGTYADYKKEFASKGIDANTRRYSMIRDYRVAYPFIFPYRTKKMTTNWSDDWTLHLTAGQLGHGFDGSHPNYSIRFFLKRTPWSTDPRWIEIYKRGRPVHK